MIRSLIIIAVLGWAVYRAHASGNYYRIRWYLWSMFLTAVAQEAYLTYFGTSYDPAYWIIYSIGTAAILVNAWLVSFEMMLRNPFRKWLGWVPVAVSGFFAAYFFIWVPVASPTGKLLAVQAAILASAGLNILLSEMVTCTLAEFVWGKNMAIRTVGQLWMAQMVMFCVMAAGWSVAPKAWGVVGHWVPAGIVILFFLRLGWHLRPEHRLPVYPVRREAMR